MGLLERYELMKQAEQEVEVSEEETKVASERIDVLAKYAEAADEALNAEYGEDYELEDVEKLAEMLIQNDLQIEEKSEEESEKVSELVEAGQVMAHAFAEELQTIADQTEEK